MSRRPAPRVTRRTLTCAALALAAAALSASPAMAQNYTVPPDNPFVNTQGARGEIYLYGMRNPFRWSFDSANGDMYVGDVGEATQEEITFIPRAEQPGANLGWNCFEGTVKRNSCAPPDYVPPSFTYTNSADVVVGGTIVHDPALPAFEGKYVYGRFNTGLKVLGPKAGGTEADGPPLALVSSVVADGVRRLWVTSLNGGLYRLVGSGSSLALDKVDPQQGGAFNQPISTAAPPGDPDRVFVVEKGGRVRNRDGSLFLDISGLVSDGGEQGLLAMAVAPDYSTSGKVYLFYTDKGYDLQVDQYVRTANGPDRSAVSTRTPIITIQHDQATNHNGGQLAFGPDGMLYLSTGDGGTQGDPEGDAQSLASLLGKIIRLDVSATGTGGVAPPPFAPPTLDTTAPSLRVRVRRHQRVLRLRGAVAHTRCDEACSVSARGVLRIRHRRLRMRPAAIAAQAGRRVRLEVRLTRRGARTLRRALRRGRRPSVALRLHAADQSGNRSAMARRTVRVRR